MTDGTATAGTAAAAGTAKDLQDERLIQATGPRQALSATIGRIRDGDLGLLPVVLGLVVIGVVFQTLNPNFLSSANLVNLLMESVPVGMIALGLVCVLLVGEIDLSVGSVSGLSSALTAVLFVDQGLPVWPAVATAVAAGAVIGFVYAQVFIRFGVPSFVITMAGLLAFLGLQLKVLGADGSINLPFDSGLVGFAQLKFVPAWLSYVLVAVTAAGLFAGGYLKARERRAAGLSGRSTAVLAARSVALLAGFGAVVWYLNRARGVGWMFVLFVVLVLLLNYALTRTRWGKSVYAVGGNVEAARRAGINVHAVYTTVFMLGTALAASGGVLAAARLAAANQSTGGGDVNLNAIAAVVIGGTSLFGGRGSAFAALLGILVIQSISSGLTLLNLDSAYRFAVTGVVLLLAVILDSVARRSRASRGRA
ncbi:sugar ABC transporter permease [Actinomadura alba]|uniref:Xylose transport system permease protein XylH n=1 Tax=Actinomadura alba TaxID=406431 RepID=A0ABR7LMM9_9ACTN|nr:sugar ABC transporter permease [Actinomadura alba]MBC6465760.1 sugar ABC transporter permease [Actinomadura alba]